MLRNLPYIIIFFSGIIGFQAISTYEKVSCHSSLLGERGPYCEIANKFTIPGRKAHVAFSRFKQLLDNKSTSGLLVKNQSEANSRFEKLNSGFTFNYQKGSRINSGYLLLSAANPSKNGEPLIELWDLNRQEIVHKWEFNIDKFLKESGIKIKKNSLTFWHPLLTNDGSLIAIADGSTLVKFSLDGDLIKLNNDFQFHHSIEQDNQGKIYVPIHKSNSMEPKYIYKGHRLFEGFAILDQDLNVLKTYMIEDIYKKAKIDYLINYESPSNDPFHINDVQPLLNDFNTKIVFLSIRNKSTILAFDLQKKSLIWLLKGYSKYQHDVDILDENGQSISIFDNNINYANDRRSRSDANIFTIIKNLPNLNKPRNSSLIIYNNYSDDQFTRELEIIQEKFNNLENNQIPKTLYEGLSEFIVENNSIFIEEAMNGRLLEVSPVENKILWQYINRNDKNNFYYKMVWSRRMKEIPTNLFNK